MSKFILLNQIKCNSDSITDDSDIQILNNKQKKNCVLALGQKLWPPLLFPPFVVFNKHLAKSEGLPLFSGWKSGQQDQNLFFEAIKFHRPNSL